MHISPKLDQIYDSRVTTFVTLQPRRPIGLIQVVYVQQDTTFGCSWLAGGLHNDTKTTTPAPTGTSCAGTILQANRQKRRALMATKTMITHVVSKTMDQSQEFSQPILSSVWFLQPLKLYESVKPYCLAFTPDQQIPRENIQRQEVPIRISDMRNSDTDFDLESNGFTLLTLPGNEQDLDWENVEDVRNIHYPEVVSAVESAISGASCRVLRHQIRKRDVYFPKSTGSDYSHGQPLRAAHVDMVQSSAEQMIQEQLGQEAKRILGRRYMVAK
ncbi:methyltransferase like protein [Diaporthe amygdali]|uniref:methyltransferase like protein n=1 Tax=Phomopsis amygdali TaxID=1214568 RepID=UPI0022FE2EB1|nr:methyltransferase like protein [Diaporthe amygdali]KAJ0120518.1 methyltransferase like protein [Diaporthe amygdali]